MQYLLCEEGDNSTLCKGGRVYHMFASKKQVAVVAAQCEHTPGSKRHMPCMCFFDMTQFPIPAVLQQQRKRTTDRPASIAIGIQGASCCSCQHGLQVICQLLHCDGVTGQLVKNINYLALLSEQVVSE